MNHTLARHIAVGAVAAGAAAALVVTAPGMAFAASSTDGAATTTVTTTATTTPAQVSSPRCTPASFTQAQQLVEADLAGRVRQLNVLSSAVGNSANHLTTADRQTLSNDVTGVELPGIQALQSQVQQVSTCVGLRGVAHSMVFTYRVYRVMTPQTHLTIVIDDESSIEGVLVNLEPLVATAIEDAEASGKDVTAAQAAFTDLKNQVSAAQGATSGQAATVLAQTPAGFPGNWAVFLSARTDATDARTDLRAAYTDAVHVRTDLQ